MWGKAGRIAIASGSGAPGTEYPDDGFTLIFNGYQSAGELVSYLLLGGAGMQGACGEGTITTSSTTTAVTGLGFQPELLIVFYNSGLSGDVDQNGLGPWSVGATDGTTQFATAWYAEYNWIADYRIFRDAKVLSVVNNGGGEDFTAAFSSFDSGGFTLSHASQATAHKFKYLALRDSGGSFKVGIETQKTSTGTKATSGVGFAPSALLFLGAGHQTANAVQTDCTYCTGVASKVEPSGTTQNAQSSSKIYNDSYSNSVWVKDARCLMHVTPAEPPGAANAEAEVDSWDSDGFTLDWLVADGTARKFGYVAFSGDEEYSGEQAWAAIMLAAGRSSDGYANQTIRHTFGAQVRGGGAVVFGAKNNYGFTHEGSIVVSNDSELGVWPEDLQGTWRIYEWGELGDVFVPRIIRRWS